MLTFLFMIFPVSLLIYFVNKENRKNILVAFTGLATGLLVCMYKWLFVHAHRVVPYSFGANYFHFLFQQILIPVLILYGLFFLISKNEIEYKIKAFFPLICSFYVIYLPYIVTSVTDSIYSSYDIFVKPVIYILAIIIISLSLFSGYEFKKSKKKIFSAGCFVQAFLILFIPALFDSVSAMGANAAVILLWGCVLMAIPGVALFFIKRFFNKNKIRVCL